MRPGGNGAALRAYNQRIALANTRRVWAAITQQPDATVLSLAAQTGLAHDTIQRALHRLRDAGYIDFDAKTTHARRIIVPFIITGKET